MSVSTLPEQTAMRDQPTGRLALLTGAGQLPIRALEAALQKQLDVSVYSMDQDVLKACRKLLDADRLHYLRFPGRLDQCFRQLHAEGINSVVFVGKINKSILLRSVVFDARGLAVWKAQRDRNDDAIMLMLIRELEKEGIQALRQTDFLGHILAQPGQYSRRAPTAREEEDIVFGLKMAKEMGRLDIGQTVVVSQGMVLAIEAIEGTDEAILRGGKWAGKRVGGVVAKVEKPNQDLRFDIPTVGPRTLKSMRKAGLSVLAIEAHKTLMLEQEEMIRLADRWNMVVVAR